MMGEELLVMNGVGETVRLSTEIVGKARRRQFGASCIDRILKELNDAPYGEAGKILRREGLYSKQVAAWRKQRTSGVGVKRGRKPESGSDLRKHNEQQ